MSFYMVEDGRFIRYNTDGTRTDVPAEEGASNMIEQTLQPHTVVISGEGIEPWTPERARQAETDLIAQAEGTAYDEISARPGLSDDQKYEQIHRAIGDNPNAVLVGVEVFGTDVATKIWGANAVALATSNNTERGDDGSPSGVIQNSQSQGLGPVPQSATLASADPTLSGGTTVGGTADTSAGGPVVSGGAGDSHRQGTASSPRADPRTGGDPILLAGGQLYLQVNDLRVLGRGIPFQFTRTYLHRTLYRGPMGFSWDHSYNLWLREAHEIQRDGTYVNVVYRSTGEVREDRYVQVTNDGAPPLGPLDGYADAVFGGPPGFFDELSKSGGTYVLRMVNGTVLTYNADLQVESIADRSGNALTFTYTNRLLTQIVDAVGKVFDFANDQYGRLIEVRDRTGGRRLAYTYDDIGNLVECDIFADPDTVTSTDYVYVGQDGPPGLEHNLIEVIGADGQASLSVTYGTDAEPWSFNRVVAQRSLDGYYQYEYRLTDTVVDDVRPSELLNLPQTVTTVTYPNGHSIDHAFNAQGNVVSRTERMGALGFGESITATYAYNSDGLLVHEQRPDGATVSYEYGVDRYEQLNGIDTGPHASSADRLGFGNLLRRRETPRSGTGEVRQLITTWSYYPGSSLVHTQRGPYYADATNLEIPGQPTPAINYTYDNAGRLTRIDYGTVQTATGAAQVLATNDYTYDATGNLTDVRVGDVRTHYDYFGAVRRSGFVHRRIEDADGLARETLYETDDLGRVTLTRDSLGAETTWEYNGFDLVTKATTPTIAGTAPTVDYIYDRMRRLTTTTQTLVRFDGTPHPDGAVITDYRYDANGRLIETLAGPSGATPQRLNRTVFTPWGQPRRIIDATGVTTELDYDCRNLLTRARLAPDTELEASQRFRYNSSGELIATIDPLGAETQFERDGFGRIHKVIDRVGTFWETERDAQGRPIQWRVRGAPPGGGAPILWSQGSQQFDSAGRLIRRRDAVFVPDDAAIPPHDIETIFLYDNLSRLVEIRRANQTIHRFAYDGLGRTVQAEDADGNVRRFVYNDAIRRLTVVTRDSEFGSVPARFEYFRTQMQFDATGRLAQTADSLGNVTRQAYDSRGLLEKAEMPDGRVLTNEYDARGHLSQQHVYGTGGPAAPLTLSFEYDAAGRPTALTNPKGERTEWSYDARGLLVTSTSPDGSRRDQYDTAGRPVVSTLPSGIAVRTSYDGEGRIVKLEPDGTGFNPPPSAPGYAPAAAEATTYDYTPDGRLQKASQGASIEFAMDSLGRILKETGPAGTFSFDWDDHGRRTRLRFPSGRQIAYQFTPAGRLTSVDQLAEGLTYPGSPDVPSARTLLQITPIGNRRRRITAPDVVNGEYHYDSSARLTAIDYRSSDGHEVETMRFLRGNDNQKVLEQSTTHIRTFDYDTFGRLTRAIDRDPTAPFDPLPLSPATDETDLPHVKRQTDLDDMAAALIAPGGSPTRFFEYEFDTNGNRTFTWSKRSPLAPTVTVPYDSATADRYDEIGGLTAVYDLDGNILSDGVHSFRYDTLGRLHETSDGATTTALTFDPLNRISSLTTDGTSQRCTWANWELVEFSDGATYAQLTPSDRPKQPAHVAAGGHELLPLTDDYASVLAWVGAASAVLGTHDYDPYGQELGFAGIEPVPLAFGGQLRCPETDLHLLYARAYDPKHGRFLQPDPIGFIDGPNMYTFAGNRPGTLTDIAGYSSTEIDWATVALNGTITAAQGIGMAALGGLAVGTGLISAPALAALGGAFLVGSAIYSYYNRSDQALAAGKTVDSGTVALLAVGDTVGVSAIYEGATGRDVVTDRVFAAQERSEKLGSGIGSLTALAAGSRAFKFGRSTATSLRNMPTLDPSLSSNDLAASGQFKGQPLEPTPPSVEEAYAALSAESLGGQRIFLVGPEGGPATRAIRIRGNLVTYDTAAPARRSMVEQDMRAIANQFGGKGSASSPPGDWATGTHGRPGGSFLGELTQPEFFYQEKGFGPYNGWQVHNIAKGFPPPSPTRPVVLSWCYSSSTRTPPLAPNP